MKHFPALSILFLFISCNAEFEVERKLPYDIHKRLVFSEHCKQLVISSNQDGYFKPLVISETNSENPVTIPIKYAWNANAYPQSISCDCQSISIIVENVKTNGFQLILYNQTTQKAKLLTDKIDEDGGSSMFCPSNKILGYLASHKPFLYLVEEDKSTPINSPPGVDFKNLNWSVNGKYLFLEDYSGDIWRYDVSTKIFKILWESNSNTYTIDRLVTPSAEDEEVFYFVSDHESEFNQIYKYSTQKGIERFVMSSFDKYLLKRPIHENNFYYRVSVNGRYFIQKHVENNLLNLNPTRGVVYDYITGQDSVEYILDAQPDSAVEIHRRKKRRVVTLTKQSALTDAPIPEVIFNKEGIHHLIFRPKGKCLGWLIWLHGGPYEQVSMRYNPYIANLVNEGWSIIAINYPGSTGIGNQYESRDNGNLLSVQIKTIRRDLNDLMAKFHFQRYGIIGISYGSILANEFAHSFGSEITSIVEISGINTKVYPSALPSLLIFGKYDYMLRNELRLRMIDEEVTNKSVQFLTIENEGHSISQNKNQSLILSKIASFLRQNDFGKK